MIVIEPIKVKIAYDIIKPNESEKRSNHLQINIILFYTV